jgi:hypothetical protein
MERSLSIIPTLKPLRAKAFSLIALEHSRMDDALAARLIDDLVRSYQENRSESWRWFEDYMTYCNARLPYALLLSYRLAANPDQCIGIALEALNFLLDVSWQPDYEGYAPVGNVSWFYKGDARPAVYDQQPVDAGALVEACSLAFRLTGDSRYRDAALAAFDWYHGRNIKRLPLYDHKTGGVCDAVTEHGLNCNQGAESILSYCLASIALDDGLRSHAQ